MPGVLMVSKGSNQNKINDQNVILLSTSDTISTNGLLATKLEGIKEYRKNKYANFINYTCNFVLKMNENLPNTKIKLIIKSKDSGGFTVEEYGYGNFDNEAVGSWQYVSILITISKEEITSIVMKFVDLNDNQITLKRQF